MNDVRFSLLQGEMPIYHPAEQENMESADKIISAAQTIIIKGEEAEQTYLAALEEVKKARRQLGVKKAQMLCLGQVILGGLAVSTLAICYIAYRSLKM